MLILLTGENKQTYNVSNPDASMTVREMAELVAGEVCKGRVRVKVEIPPGAEKLGYAPYSGYKLNADRIKRLKWQPKYGLKDMYERLIADWQSNN
jgi:nucleoside-diphosphate-sugar epimerase